MTTSFDLDQLGLTAQPEVVDPTTYVPPYNDTDQAIDKGVYVCHLVDGKFKPTRDYDGEDRIPVRFSGSTSKKNNQTYLRAEFAISVSDAIVNGKVVGEKIRYGAVDLIPERLKFNEVKKGRENANTFMDLLIAFGYAGRLATNEDYKQALVGLVASGATARASVNKEAYCNPKSNEYAGCGNTIRGEESFIGTPNDDGTGVDGVGHEVPCPGNHPPDQRPILTARNTIKRFYPIKGGK